MRSVIAKEIDNSLVRLLEYCEANDWRGYDPYDGLNSRILKATPFNRSSVARLILTQFCKRSPINLRKFLLVEKGYNPKGLGLFLSSLLKLYSVQAVEEYKELLLEIIQLLMKDSSRRYSGYCWGYNFDWQSRTSFVPKGTPNTVCTTFAANAFLDAHEVLKNEEFAAIARSSCNFILKDLNVASENGAVCFSYTPLDKLQVHNVNLLAAALLSRVYRLTGEEQLLRSATRAVRFSLSHQNKDGSWHYGTLPCHQWVDNFHTGFNLVALNNFMKFSGQSEFQESLERGFNYYKNHFFAQDLVPKYYDNGLYPIDIHSVAQAIVTFVRLKSLDDGNLELAKQIALWAIKNMQDKRGYFYFQKHCLYTNRIPYMRWSQAWMLYALSLLLSELNSELVGKASTGSKTIREKSSVFSR